MMILTEPGPVGEASGPVSLAIGVFDGVHLGHQAVIHQTLGDARAVRGTAIVVTFDRHPVAILNPARAPALVLPLWRRLEIIAELGVDTALVCAFDEAFSRLPAEVFLERLFARFAPVTSICVGAGFVFGHRRGGSVELLRRWGRERGFAVHGIDPLRTDGQVISSTRLREGIAAGDWKQVTALLGRPYEIAGEVVAGDRLGRQLGFPTANLEVGGLVLPPRGVYVARARGDGMDRPAAVNIGVRPTVDGGAPPVRVEVHLLDFDGDLYGRRLKVELHGRLREERRFGSREALVDQIGLDVAAVREWDGGKSRA